MLHSTSSYFGLCDIELLTDAGAESVHSAVAAAHCKKIAKVCCSLILCLDALMSLDVSHLALLTQHDVYLLFL